MANEELFYLKWNNFQKNVKRMRDEEELFDITFACEGKKIGAHKLVLYSCSPYFKDLLKENHSQHPIFFFHDIAYDILKAIIDYMYLGEVHISNDNLKDFIRVAEALQIRGLSKDTSTTDDMGEDEQVEESTVRKRTNNDDQQVHTNYSTTGKRLKIINESALNEDDDDMADDDIPQIRINSKRDSNVQPKVEALEFLEDTNAHHLHSQQPAQSSSASKQAQNITYVNIENFVEKTSNSAMVQPQQQQQPVTQYIQAGTSQQQNQQSTVDYKSEDELWEKAMDIAGQTEATPKSKNKNSASYKANCLTPRSCPMCARVYSNVSNLRQHMRLIHNPQAVVCPICQKHFNSDLYLKRHFASIHQSSQGSESDSGAKNESTGSIGNTNNWSYQSTDGSIIQQ